MNGGVAPPLRSGGEKVTETFTFTVPPEALAPKALCGVRHCAIPTHWRTWHTVTGTLRDGGVSTLYVDGERWD